MHYLGCWPLFLFPSKSVRGNHGRVLVLLVMPELQISLCTYLWLVIAYALESVSLLIDTKRLLAPLK